MISMAPGELKKADPVVSATGPLKYLELNDF
jgi:hypothetical protein